MKLKRLALVSMFFLLVMFIAACSGKEGAGSNNNHKEQGESSLSGSVSIDGSGTVYPLMALLAEEYMVKEEEGVSVEVSRAGTSAGFKKFLVENGTDFNNASRKIKDEELALVDELEIDVKEIKVALDGLTFVINKDNDWATEMTAEELKSIFLASSSVEKWSDIRPEWPEEEINLYGPNENHGTYEFFFENILEKEDLKNKIDLQQEYSSLVKLISDDPNGIAFFGFGYYVNNTDVLQAVKVDFGSGPVEASLETIAEDGPYAPFTRPVFTYLNATNVKDKSEVLDFAFYVLNHIDQFAGEVGFAPIPEDEIQKMIEQLEELK